MKGLEKEKEYGWKVPVRYCEGKVCFDKRGAETAANKRWNEDRVELRIYACPNCRFWHLTKKR